MLYNLTHYEKNLDINKKKEEQDEMNEILKKFGVPPKNDKVSRQW